MLLGLALGVFWVLSRCFCRTNHGIRRCMSSILPCLRSVARFCLYPRMVDRSTQVETIFLHSHTVDGLRLILTQMEAKADGLRAELEGRIVSMVTYRHRTWEWYVGSVFSPSTADPRVLMQRVVQE